MAMDPEALPSTIHWVTFIAQPPATSWYQYRIASDADHLPVSCSHMHIGSWSRTRGKLSIEQVSVMISEKP
jgi:hypothetical protein